VKVGRVARAFRVQCQLERQVRRTPARTPRNGSCNAPKHALYTIGIQLEVSTRLTPK
jgi:hypothetical protein